VTPKTKTHIYHAIVKSTITYAAETWCLKAKATAKLNSTEMDFWRRSARISRKDKIRNNVIKKKNERDKIHFRRHKNYRGSMVWTCPQDGGGGTAKRSTEMAAIREKETRQTQTYLGGGD
jgi:hypothetical protein